MLNFKDCTLHKLDKRFGLNQVSTMAAMDHWLAGRIETSELERYAISLFRAHLQTSGYDWNETELACNFIGPIMGLADFVTKQFSFFSERPFAGIVDGVELSGKPDGMIASGFREPEQPFFCFQEYKKQKDPEGDPAGQALAAMLVAQELNEHHYPIYGAYIIGADWCFMVLQGKQYAISPAYVATRDDVFDIFCILKVLKQIIVGIIKNLSNNTLIIPHTTCQP